jgi:hypothetical protein
MDYTTATITELEENVGRLSKGILKFILKSFIRTGIGWDTAEQ